MIPRGWSNSQHRQMAGIASAPGSTHASPRQNDPMSLAPFDAMPKPSEMTARSANGRATIHTYTIGPRSGGTETVVLQEQQHRPPSTTTAPPSWAQQQQAVAYRTATQHLAAAPSSVPTTKALQPLAAPSANIAMGRQMAWRPRSQPTVLQEEPAPTFTRDVGRVPAAQGSLVPASLLKLPDTPAYRQCYDEFQKHMVDLEQKRLR